MELRKAEEELNSLENCYSVLCGRILLEEICGLKPLRQSGLPVSSDGGETNACSTTSTTSAISAEEMLHTLIELREKLMSVQPLVEKIRMRLMMKDPVTNAPRYGKKTIDRVHRIIDKYTLTQNYIDEAFGETTDANAAESTVQTLKSFLKRKKEDNLRQKQIEDDKHVEITLNKKKEEEMEALESKQLEEEKRMKQQLERENLRKRAEEARSRRIESERQALEQERLADIAFLSSIEVGKSGVKNQLQRLRETCSEEEFSVSLRALHTIFSQISSRPEEIQFRRIRRDHPKFMEDIGRHRGGKEILIAAGFTFKEIDGVKCFFSAEPDLESNMDAWSSWYQLMKDTLKVLDEELSSR